MTEGAKSDGRASNGRKPSDLSALIGTKIGTRTVVGASVCRVANSTRQLVHLECVCGTPMKTQMSTIKHGLSKCRACRGTGVRKLAPQVRHDYQAMVGTTRGKFEIVSLVTDPRPVFTLRCAEGHLVPRLAWDVVRHSPKMCSECVQGRKTREVDAAEPEDYGKPEVCSCRYVDGRLQRPCKDHREAA